MAPQPLTGTIILNTSGFTAEQAFNLNNELLKQSRRFINEVNQTINVDQNLFAKKEVQIAENKLKEATRALEFFKRSMEISVLSRSSLQLVHLSPVLNHNLSNLKWRKLLYVVSIVTLMLRKSHLLQTKCVNFSLKYGKKGSFY